MPGLTNQVAQALANAAANVSGILGSSPTPVSTIPGTPYVVVGAPKGTLAVGSWEIREYTFPLHYLVERVNDEALDQAVVNDAVDSFIAQFNTGITLGGLVISAEIVSFDTDVFSKLGATDYQAITFSVQVTVAGAGGVTP